MTARPPAEVTRQLARMVRQAQAQARVPAVAVALRRADRPLWTFEVGGSGTGRALDAGTQFRIGSVTKTFTAALVMQCRDDGLLDLDDEIGKHLPVPAHGELTVRRLLSHTGGIQREPYGDVWYDAAGPDTARLLADVVRAERVLPPGRRWHYSNLGFALLGHLAARLRGGTWAEVLADRVLDPLGLSSISVLPTDRAAVGYLVDAYSDHARPEPPLDTAGVGPAGQLWGNATDLATWAAFLADPATVDPDGKVLAAATVEEMRHPVSIVDEQQWTIAFGLGLIVWPRPDRIMHVGHDGAMPGFLSGVYGRRGGATPRGMGAAVLGSSGTGDAILELPHRLLARSLELDPPDIRPWRPGPPAPEEYRSVLGRWWSEGFEHVFRWRNGRLESQRVDALAGKPPAVFAPTGDPDVLRTVSGRETGELLRLTRDAAGQVVTMHWATYRFTRVQETFDGFPAHEP